jgi:tryptophan-rich sensory protein
MKMWLFPLWVIIDVLCALSALSLWIAAPEYKTLNIGLSVFAVTLGMLLSFMRWESYKYFFAANILNVFFIIR